MGKGKELKRINDELVDELEDANCADSVELVDRRTGKSRVVDFMFVAGMHSAAVGMKCLMGMGADELADIDGESVLKAAIGAYFESNEHLEDRCQR